MKKEIKGMSDEERKKIQEAISEIKKRKSIDKKD